MSSDEDYMDDSDYGSGSDGDDEIFEAPAVQAQESTFSVLTPEDCEKLAEHEVQSVTELLCCPPAVGQLLLRHFRWDRDKLTDGATAACPTKNVLARPPACA